MIENRKLLFKKYLYLITWVNKIKQYKGKSFYAPHLLKNKSFCCTGAVSQWLPIMENWKWLQNRKYGKSYYIRLLVISFESGLMEQKPCKALFCLVMMFGESCSLLVDSKVEFNLIPTKLRQLSCIKNVALYVLDREMCFEI